MIDDPGMIARRLSKLRVIRNFACISHTYVYNNNDDDDACISHTHNNNNNDNNNNNINNDNDNNNNNNNYNNEIPHFLKYAQIMIRYDLLNGTVIRKTQLR